MNIDTAIEIIGKPATIKFRLACAGVTIAVTAIAMALILPAVHANAVKRADVVQFKSSHGTIESPEAETAAVADTTTTSTAKPTTTLPAPSNSHVQQIASAAPTGLTATTTPGMPPEPTELQNNVPGPFEPCETMSTECDMDHDYIEITTTTEVKLAEQPLKEAP